jgi:hypothetical protein
MNWVASILLMVMMVTGIGLSIVAAQRDAAQRETCSYYCLATFRKWPTAVVWKGRDQATQRIKCECLYAERVDD